MMKKCFLSSLLMFSIAKAEPKRIQSEMLNLSEAKSILLYPGLASVLVLPCHVSEATSGDESQVEVRPNPHNRRIVHLNLKSAHSKKTNLIIRCEGKTEHIVFDIKPSKTEHQDVIQVRGLYGSAQPGDIKPEENPEPIKIKIKEPKLIQSSERRTL